MIKDDQELIKVVIEESIETKRKILETPGILDQIQEVSKVALDVLRSGRKIIFAGNGGSFADAQHLSAEFTSRFLFDRAPLASIALGTNNSAISAIGNDYGYENVFARELSSIGLSKDLFIPLSTSGNSPNILAACEVANSLGIHTVAFTGESGGKLGALCECLKVPSLETARIQESHIMLGHILCELVEGKYFRK